MFRYIKKPKPIAQAREDKEKFSCGEKLSESLDENIALMKKIFDKYDTLIERRIENQNDASIKCCIFYTDGLVKNEIINDNVIRPVQLAKIEKNSSPLADALIRQILQPNGAEKTNDLEKIIQAIVYGDTVLFAEGSSEAIILNTKGFILRSIEEPESEKVLQGPREGFNESILSNLSMIRRKIRTPDLKMQFRVFGERTKTRACILYIEGIADKKIVDEMQKRLDKICMDSAVDIHYILEMISDMPFSFFKIIGETERPDIVAAKLLEGRVALVLDGTPVAITVPYLFIENFQNPEDYYVNYYYSSFTRILRIISFIITISVPAFYVAVVNFHQEMLPTPMLLSVSAARQGVPFPNIVEATIMIIVFEVLAETGIRMPAGIGQTLSIVGALVIGQAAVEAKIVSAPMVIIVSITGITSLVISKLNPASVLIRFMLLACAAFLGIYGLMLGMVTILIHLINTRSFGVPYITDFMTTDFQRTKDIFIRAPWWTMITRPDFSVDKIRLKSNGAPKP